MNAEQARKLNLPDLMARLGYQPVKIEKDGQELWYASPFRKETDPSFHTSFLGGKWIWNDFGDSGGTVIDFVMRHENFSSVKDVLSFLRKLYHGDLFATPQERNPHQMSFSFQSHNGEAVRENFSGLEFVGVKPLQSPLIFQYLAGRRIDAERAKRFLVLVHYRNKKHPSKRPYFAFGQQNLSGGYEIRSASDGTAKFKSALICRDITLIPGTDSSKKTVSIFEGMLDHISLLVMLNAQSLRGDTIIMNALSSYHRTRSYIFEQGYSEINLFLDNDEPGEQVAESFTKDFGEKVKNQAQLYAPHKDINVALVAGHELKM